MDPPIIISIGIIADVSLILIINPAAEGPPRAGFCSRVCACSKPGGPGLLGLGLRVWSGPAPQEKRRNPALVLIWRDIATN